MGFSVLDTARASGRLCPTCGRTADVRQCPHDGSPTFFVAGHPEHHGPVGLGERVGNYIVQAPIGRGGHATVYRAERLLGLGDVALKVLHIDRADPQGISRFYREALIGARLSHPNTVRVLDVGQADSGAIFLAMELLHGETWESRLLAAEAHGGTMAPPEAIAIAAEVLRGLAEAHDQGVVHRDLKPSNVMLAEAGGEAFVKIMDFGVAHVLRSGLTEDGRAIGTPAYMSPEQCSGGKVDGRSDLYATGIALYRALAGRLPFSDSSALGMMYAHTNLPPIDIAATVTQPLPPGLASVVMRALAKDPNERFADARAMRQALEAVLSGQALDVRRAEPRPRLSQEVGDDSATPAMTDSRQQPPAVPSHRFARQGQVVAMVAVLGVVASAVLAFASRPRDGQVVPAVQGPPVVVAARPAAPLEVAAPVTEPVVAAAVEAEPPPIVSPSAAASRPHNAKLLHRQRSHMPTAPVLPP